jgi:hypothetical protein
MNPTTEHKNHLDAFSAHSAKAELRWHGRDLRASVGAGWRRMQQVPLWMAMTIVVLAFALGWIGGHQRGVADNADLENFSSAFKHSFAAQNRAEGESFLAEKFHLSEVDRLVRAQIDADERSSVALLWDATGSNYWSSRGRDQKFRAQIIRHAERRLALIKPPQPETLAEFQRVGRGTRAESYLQLEHFTKVARDYTKLLGRDVQASQLTPDAYLREVIYKLKQDQREAGTSPSVPR